MRSRTFWLGSLFAVSMLVVESLPSVVRDRRARVLIDAARAAVDSSGDARVPIGALSPQSVDAIVVEPYTWQRTIRRPLTDYLPTLQAIRYQWGSPRGFVLLLDANGRCIDVRRVSPYARIESGHVVVP
jgi:hypothetical protein